MVKVNLRLSKKAVAQRYFPSLSPNRSKTLLWLEVLKRPEMYERWQALEHNKMAKEFTPELLALIREYLGTPEEFALHHRSEL